MFLAFRGATAELLDEGDPNNGLDVVASKMLSRKADRFDAADGASCEDAADGAACEDTALTLPPKIETAKAKVKAKSKTPAKAKKNESKSRDTRESCNQVRD